MLDGMCDSKAASALTINVPFWNICIVNNILYQQINYQIAVHFQIDHLDIAPLPIYLSAADLFDDPG